MRFCKSLYTLPLFLAIFVMMFSTCRKPKEQDIIGPWIILSAKYNHQKLIMPGYTAKFELMPTGFEGKSIIKFEPNGSITFPGIYSYDVPCTWGIANDSLKITLDSLQVRTDAIRQFDDLRVQSMLKHDSKLMDRYKAKCDSALAGGDVIAIEKAALVYTGLYKIKLDRSLLTITSPTTEFYLINEDDVVKYRVHQITGR